jgi:hypothetical protein
VIDNDWHSVSIDGSAFDSTQYAQLMDSCENKMFRKIQNDPDIRDAYYHMCQHPDSDFQIDRTTADNLWTSLHESACKNTTFLYTRVPDHLTDAKPWPKEVVTDFMKRGEFIPPQEREHPHLYYMYTPLIGTTFSGHSTKTTLGNTLRSILYMLFYVYKSGTIPKEKFFENVWDKFPIQASGDDTVLFCKEKAHAVRIAKTIRELTHETKIPPLGKEMKGLAQCVPDIIIGKWYQ